MKRPSFQFYPADWRANAKLRRCTHAQRGIWIEVMCLLHDAEEYGLLRWPLEDIAQAIGCKLHELQTLQKKGVLKGADEGEQCAAFIFTPRHAGKAGAPVTLVAAQPGPVWYSSRMVEDEHVRQHRGVITRFNGQPKVAPKAAPNPPPMPPIGDGASSSSSSSSIKPSADAGKKPPASPKDFLFQDALQALKAQGVEEVGARSLLGRLIKHRGELQAAEDMRGAIASGVVGLRDWIGGILRGPTKRQAPDADLTRSDYGAGLPVAEAA
jgi:hypothetical protein